MRKLMQMLGIIEDDEFESIVATFQTTVDKLTALIDRKTALVSAKTIEAETILSRAQAEAAALVADTDVARDVIAQAQVTRSKLADLLGT